MQLLDLDYLLPVFRFTFVMIFFTSSYFELEAEYQGIGNGKSYDLVIAMLRFLLLMRRMT